MEVNQLSHLCQGIAEPVGDRMSIFSSSTANVWSAPCSTVSPKRSTQVCLLPLYQQYQRSRGMDREVVRPISRCGAAELHVPERHPDGAVDSLGPESSRQRQDEKSGRQMKPPHARSGTSDVGHVQFGSTSIREKGFESESGVEADSSVKVGGEAQRVAGLVASRP
nr:hypothetical protein CFP56_22474 [Quercus suber]